MTTATAAMSVARTLGTDRRPGIAGFSIGDTWARYRAYWSTLSALRALTDKELEDIGFRREDLKAVARAATL